MTSSWVLNNTSNLATDQELLCNFSSALLNVIFIQPIFLLVYKKNVRVLICRTFRLIPNAPTAKQYKLLDP